MDKEYTLCFESEVHGLQELTSGKGKAQAMKDAMFYIKRGATNMTIKLYEEGDIRHQWDYKPASKTWMQYE